MVKIGIMGATGYAGRELVSILLRHSKVEISLLQAKMDAPSVYSAIFPEFYRRLELICELPNTKKVIKNCELVFLALPHKVSMIFVPELLNAGLKVIDLSADYRLDAATYKHWYGAEHTDKANIAKAAYGLPELYREKIKKANLIANPGCYPTSAILGLAPLVKEKAAVSSSIIIDSKSGTSGAGRTASLALSFAEVNENFKAYKVNKHQHSPEMNQELSKLAGEAVEVVFTPHLLPINRGILSTMYVKFPKRLNTKEVIEVYRKFYKDEPFVRVFDEGSSIETKNVSGTNFCDIGVVVDERKSQAIILSAIDNLVKGASGQAVENMNIMCGFEETEALL